MSRITYQMLKEWTRSWNEAYPELAVTVSAYNGYYHIGLAGKGGSIKRMIAVEQFPGKAWDVFCTWRDGVYTGMSFQKKDK